MMSSHGRNIEDAISKVRSVEPPSTNMILNPIFFCSKQEAKQPEINFSSFKVVIIIEMHGSSVNV